MKLYEYYYNHATDHGLYLLVEFACAWLSLKLGDLVSAYIPGQCGGTFHSVNSAWGTIRGIN